VLPDLHPIRQGSRKSDSSCGPTGKSIACILAAAQEIQMTPNIFERVYQNMLRRCNARIEVDGRHYEQLL